MATYTEENLQKMINEKKKTQNAYWAHVRKEQDKLENEKRKERNASLKGVSEGIADVRDRFEKGEAVTAAEFLLADLLEKSAEKFVKNNELMFRKKKNSLFQKVSGFFRKKGGKHTRKHKPTRRRRHTRKH